MNICVISPKACEKSAKELAKALGATYCNPYETQRSNFTQHAIVFNYGCGDVGINAKNFVNKPASAYRCIDKIATLHTLQKAGIPIPDYAVAHKEAQRKGWETTVVRTDLYGKHGQDCLYIDKGEDLPNGLLFTEYFEHDVECRIVVYKGEVVGRYLKEDTADYCALVPVEKKGFKKIDNACIKGAKALAIDYVGFDVLVKRHPVANKFVILEANSGPILTPEVKDAIINDLKGE